MKKRNIIIAILSIIMLVSTVSAVPNIKAEPEETTIFENLENKVIEKFGKEFQEDYKFNMKLAFCENFKMLYYANFEDKTVSIHSEQQAFEPLFDLTVAIMYIILLLFGHNLLGDTLAIVTAMLVLIIPCLVVAFGMSIPLSFEILAMGVMSATGINLEQFIYDFGLIGLGLFTTVVLPLMLTISIVLIPILWVSCTITNMIDCLIIAIEMLNSKKVS